MKDGSQLPPEDCCSGRCNQVFPARLRTAQERETALATCTVNAMGAALQMPISTRFPLVGPLEYRRRENWPPKLTPYSLADFDVRTGGARIASFEPSLTGYRVLQCISKRERFGLR